MEFAPIFDRNEPSPRTNKNRELRQRYRPIPAPNLFLIHSLPTFAEIYPHQELQLVKQFTQLRVFQLTCHLSGFNPGDLSFAQQGIAAIKKHLPYTQLDLNQLIIGQFSTRDILGVNPDASVWHGLYDLGWRPTLSDFLNCFQR